MQAEKKKIEQLLKTARGQMVGSMRTAPGRSRPLCSASWIIDKATRSLTLPAGLKDSSFARIRAPSPCSCAYCLSSSKGVFPISSVRD